MVTETFDQSWWPKALCWGAAPEHINFFPDPGDGDKSRIRELKAFCRPCPVRLECVQGAMERNEEWGIWGGYEAKEIRKLKNAGLSAVAALAKKAA